MRTLKGPVIGRSGIYDQRSNEEAVHDGIAQCSEKIDLVTAAAPPATRCNLDDPRKEGEIFGDEGLRRYATAGGDRRESTSNSREGSRRENCRSQEMTRSNVNPRTSALCDTDPATEPAILRESPQIHSETPKRQNSKNRPMRRQLEAAESGGATLTVPVEIGKGWEKQEAEEEPLRRILCELGRQELEYMQERMQRSVGYLLETQKEKQAEQVTLLQERRRLDATLAHAQNLLKQYSAGNVRDSGQSSRSSCTAVPKETSTTSVKLLISASVSRTGSPVSPLHLCDRGSVMRGEAASAEITSANAPTQPHPRGREICHDFARHSEIKNVSSPRNRAGELCGEGDESILADLLDDLLHRYAPAAVKGVGVAAHKVKEGLTVLRHELLALQQHQQATEKQRAIERHARCMLRLEEEMERVQHYRVLQHLKNLHVSAASDSRRPYVYFSEERVVDGGTAPGGAGKPPSLPNMRPKVDTSVSDQALLRSNEGGYTSSLSEIPDTSCIACEVERERTCEASGAKTFLHVASSKPPEAYIPTTGEPRLDDAAAVEAYEVHQRAPQSRQQIHAGSASPHESASGPAAPSSPLEISTTAAVSHPSYVAKPADADVRDGHSVQTDGVIEKNLNPPEDFSILSSAKHASLFCCRGMDAVERKATPCPCHFCEYRLDIGKNETEAEALTSGKKHGVDNVSNSRRRGGRGENQRLNLPSSGCPASASFNPEPRVSAAKPSAYRKLGTRKERLQRTAASLDSLSRGVVDAVGSVKHTVARWFSAFENSPEASTENGAGICRNTASDSTTARTHSGADCATGENRSSVEPSFSSVKSTDVDSDYTLTTLEKSFAAVGSAAVEQRFYQGAQQLAHVSSIIVSRDGDELPGMEEIPPQSSKEATSASEASTRKSSVFSITTQAADGGVVDKVSDIAEELLCSAGAETNVHACPTNTVLQAQKGGEGRQEKCRGGHVAIPTQSPSASEGTRQLVRATSDPLANERRGAKTVPVASTGGFLVNPRAITGSKAAKPSRSFSHSNEQLGGADLPPLFSTKVASCSKNSVGAQVEGLANGGEGPAHEQDLVVIEALIRVNAKHGIVALPLVVLATEQCRDIAEDWVDRHWVQLQQTQFWLMRGKTGSSETAPETGDIRVLAPGSESCDGIEAGKRNTETHLDELPGGIVRAERSACGGGPAKTTFLTRSRAIHSLAAFLGNAEATSEKLPVRVVEDWANIVSSPSEDTTRVPRHSPRQEVGRT